MKVAHLFRTYLKPTENWCYRMISSLEDVEIVLVSDRKSCPNKFHIAGAQMIIPSFVADDSDEVSFVRQKVINLRKYVWKKFQMPSKLVGVDILHAHFADIGWKYLGLKRQLNIPMLISFYGFDYDWLLQTKPEWKVRFPKLFSDGDLFLTEGNVGKKKLIGLGCPKEKIRVVPLGVNAREIPNFKRIKRRNDLRLVQVASFTEKKGQDTTVRAFARALETSPNMELTLVGRDRDQTAIRGNQIRLCAQLGISNNVKFLDGVDFNELHEFLANFHVFIHPSKHAESGDNEGGAPVVLLDAQATGMPVLSTTHCDIPDIVINGESGFLFPEDDDVSLANGIIRFYMMEQEEFNRYSANARKHVEEEYDVIKCANYLKSVYKEIL